MKRLVILLVLMIIIATSVLVLWQRHTVERNNKTVSFLMHGPDILQHSKDLDTDLAAYLQSLQEVGMSGLVIPYGLDELREIARNLGLDVVMAFHYESSCMVLSGVEGDEVVGITFLSADSGIDPDVLSSLPPEVTLYLIQRNDTFRGYLPSKINQRIVAEGMPAVRTYRISYWEMDNPDVTPDNMVPRWLGNIREYNARVIYARPFFDGGVDKNVYYVTQVANALYEAGYTIGTAQPFADFFPAPPITILVFLGAGAVVLGLMYVLSLPSFLVWTGLAGVLLGTVLMLTPYALPLQLGMALMSAIAASCLGVIWALRGKAGETGTSWWQTFAIVNLLTIGSALLTVALLSDTAFIMEYQFFRGVKLQYVLPLLVVAAYVLFKAVGVREMMKVFTWSWKITVLAGIVALGALTIYVIRSGNVESVPQLEIWLRAWFDDTLIARPRFKELVAHPILLIILYYRKSLLKGIFALGILAATVGQVSIVNTFLHLRTPLEISIFRVFHGLWIGTILGLAGIWMIAVISRYYSRAGGQIK